MIFFHGLTACRYFSRFPFLSVNIAVLTSQDHRGLDGRLMASLYDPITGPITMKKVLFMRSIMVCWAAVFTSSEAPQLLLISYSFWLAVLLSLTKTISLIV